MLVGRGLVEEDLPTGLPRSSTGPTDSVLLNWEVAMDMLEANLDVVSNRLN